MGVFLGYDTRRENVNVGPGEAWLSLLLALLVLRLDLVDGFKAVASVIMQLSCLWDWATREEKVLIICQLHLFLLFVAVDILNFYFNAIGHYI